MILCDFQIVLGLGSGLSAEEKKRANIELLPVDESMRFRMKKMKIRADYRKLPSPSGLRVITP